MNNKYKLKRKIYAFSIVGIFILGISLAKFFGVWDNSITNEEYKYHINNLNGADYFHIRGQVSSYDENKWKENQNNQKPEIEINTTK